MKKYFILFLVCLIVFGGFVSIYSEEKTPHQKWLDAEKALSEAQKRLTPLETEEITKQECTEALGIKASLAGQTLSYMMQEKKDIQMISPPATEADPKPKKRFRLKT